LKENIPILVLDFLLQSTAECSAAKAPLEAKECLADCAICVREGSDTPLFFVHDGAGELAYLPLLASHIHSEIPIYGLPAQSADETAKRTMEVMAMRMVRMVRTVQPVGPYRLAGWSFGGVLAYEIATQLIGADEKVEFIGLLDSTYLAGIKDPAGPIPKFNEKDLLVSMMQHHPALNQDENVQRAVSELQSSSATMDFTAIVRRLQELSLTPENWKHLPLAQIQQSLTRVHSCMVANSGYSAQRIAVPITLFVSDDHPSVPLRGWNAALPSARICVKRIPGTHLSMLSVPNVEILGQALTQAIRAVPTSSKNTAEKDYGPLAVLQTGQRTMSPLFCVPGAGASVGSFVELTTHLKSWPMYGFEPRGLDGTMLPHSTVPAAAQSYLRALRGVYPNGPVQLFGHSFGGWVVFEMANRLIEAGRDVSLLTILDSWVPEDDAITREYNHIEAIMDWIDIFEMLLERSFGISDKDLESRNEKARMELLHSRLVNTGLMPRRSKPEELYGSVHTFAMSLRTHYKPDKQYMGPVQLVLVDDSRLDHAANRQRHELAVQGWKRWAPNLIYLKAPGNHMTTLKSPHVLELAGFISNPGRANAVQGT
jgi:arthrofactin-type cyclic lipopeptide synthetase C